MDIHPEFPKGLTDIPDFNENHNPSRDISKMTLADDVYIIWRVGTPQERKLDKIIRPGGDQVEYKYPPNCALVVAVGKECKKAKLGEYVFWTYAGYDTEKPIPIVFDFMDKTPTIFVIQEKHVLFSSPPAPAAELSSGDLFKTAGGETVQ